MSSANGPIADRSPGRMTGSDGGSVFTGYKVMYKMTGSDADYMSMDAAADDTSATIRALTPNTELRHRSSGRQRGWRERHGHGHGHD